MSDEDIIRRALALRDVAEASGRVGLALRAVRESPGSVAAAAELLWADTALREAFAALPPGVARACRP